ncbi:MAG: glycosyltransferase, partial [Candidatus Nanohaloarchaea archaeon]
RPVFDLAVRFYDFLERKAWSNFDRVVANSEVTAGRIREKGLAEAVEVVHPGADVEENEPGEFGDYFLYPSRFRRYKRQDLALEAFKRADLDDFRLILAGSNQEPDYVEELREKSGGDVRIETDVSDERWHELFENAYSVLFLAENEDWGIIPIEAASYGKPVIAVDEGGPQESVVDGETGFLVEPESERIAEKMEELANSSEKVEKMGEKAVEESKKYSWENFKQKLDAVIGE